MSKSSDGAAARKPVRADAKRNREALVAAARDAFDTGRFYDLRFDDFAPLAGVGTGTLYRHFPTRTALAEAVYHEEVAALCEHARELQAELPAGEALAAFVRDMVSHVYANQGLARTLSTLMATDSAALADGGLAVEQAVTDLVAAAVDQGAIRQDANAGAILIALHGIGGAHDRPDWRIEADALIALVIDGLHVR